MSCSQQATCSLSHLANGVPRGEQAKYLNIVNKVLAVLIVCQNSKGCVSPQCFGSAGRLDSERLMLITKWSTQLVHLQCSKTHLILCCGRWAQLGLRICLDLLLKVAFEGPLTSSILQQLCCATGLTVRSPKIVNDSVVNLKLLLIDKTDLENVVKY